MKRVHGIFLAILGALLSVPVWLIAQERIDRNFTPAGSFTTGEFEGDVTVGGNLTAGNLAAGTTSPTCAAVSNVDATVCTANGTHYLRYGTVVTGAWTGTIDPTAAAPTGTSVRFNPPVASNFGAAADAIGTCTHSTTLQTLPGIISADAANDALTVNFQATNAGNLQWRCTFAYRIL